MKSAPRRMEIMSTSSLRSLFTRSLLGQNDGGTTTLVQKQCCHSFVFLRLQEQQMSITSRPFHVNEVSGASYPDINPAHLLCYNAVLVGYPLFYDDQTSPVGAIKVRESEVFKDQKNDGGKVSGCTGGKSDPNEDLDDLFWDDNNRFSAPDLGITETSHSGEKPVDHNQGSEETQSWAMGVL
ncbi:hypothetical protein SAY87_012322 [Trapa incisa]|uniref:Uncharacterized protein n=1 Tax=Trapa incisa TaxID=236973 RepID=A0AAN7GNQ7_9MYRT|nr:hypothetical protein SAY87_012322 [Trapa incisa]